MNHKCRTCNVELNDENWHPSFRKGRNYLCKECDVERSRQWKKVNPEKVKAQRTRSHRKAGQLPLNENKECPSYLGVHVAERMLSRVFKDVTRMPYGTPGYDVICNRNKLIDIKSSCLRTNGQWLFHISHNTTADFFLCLAFDNREDLNPLHAWLIPGSKVNHLASATIRHGTIDKWDEYKLGISKIESYCDLLRGV